MPLYPIVAPCSASFLCLNAFLYFVLSYVTKATTIRAMTDIPAKTPNPMGRTCNCWPGSWKAAADAVASAAEADAVEAACCPTAVPAAAELDTEDTADATEPELEAELADVAVTDPLTVMAVGALLLVVPTTTAGAGFAPSGVATGIIADAVDDFEAESVAEVEDAPVCVDEAVALVNKVEVVAADAEAELADTTEPVDVTEPVD